MMMPLQTYVRQGKYKLRDLMSDPRFHLFGRAAAYVLSGFCLSAASIGNSPLPLGLCLVMACCGWSAVLSALGSCLGYLLFWGSAGNQCIAWVLVGLVCVIPLGEQKFTARTPLLLPALAGLIVSATGVVFQAWLQEKTAIGIYLLRVSLAVSASWLFARILRGRNPVLDWLACALAVLALAQIAPVQYLSFGVIAAGALTVSGAFPACALSGLALDLSGITPVSMTAVLCGGYLVRFLPNCPRWLRTVAPPCAYLTVMGIQGYLDLTPLPGLLLGGFLGFALPFPASMPARRGETGVAQVRLELAANVLSQSGQLLLDTPEIPIDEEALVFRAAQQACNSCPCRKTCKDSRRIAQLPSAVLHKPLLTPEELPIICRKSGRFLAQLHRSQEQLRSLRADREHQREYRAALVQQYRFLSGYLQDLSDSLSRKTDIRNPCFVPKIHVYGNRPEADNGDRCLFFSGSQCKYYVLLCDGMGTGIGAVQEGKTAGELLRRLLTAGYPADHALQSLNNLCALRNRAGAVTIDLLELQLDSGKATLYKWGAAPSYMVFKYGAEKIGTAGPPPGLSVTEKQESAYRLSLRRGEILLLVSDGVGEEEALRCCMDLAGCSPGELARSLLTHSRLSGEDDATVVTVHLEQKQLGQ